MKKNFVVFLLVFTMISISACARTGTIDNSNQDTKLVSVQNRQELLKLLGDMGTNNYDNRIMFGMDKPVMESSKDSYSETNVQVSGVDEADIVKTDGKYIYSVNNDKLVITLAYPADKMRIVNILDYSKEAFFPTEIYIDTKYLVVIGNTNRFMLMEETTKQNRYIHVPNQESVRVIIYSIKDPEKAEQIRDFEVEGHYLSSRKIDSKLYLVTNRYIFYYPEEVSDEQILPWYKDSIKTEGYTVLDYEKIHYFPDGREPSYLIIAGLDLDKINDDLNIEAFLGSGQTIYASQESLYVTVSRWEYEDLNKTNSGISNKTGLVRNRGSITNTVIYKFSMKNGMTSFVSKGQVPGSLLNQFSMDESDGYFRVATTTNGAEENNLYILDSKLEIVGKIEGIAPGERIYSVRFIGNRGYMVTFKTMDPLFVLDLSDPKAPKILGELKIPGFSDYLHPYDQDHLIGFGMDTQEINMLDGNGKIVGTRATTLGMKISIFDVSDVNRPLEKFAVKIGDQGTYSDLLYNHKALVFDKDKDILAFPVSVMKTGDEGNDYGRFEFQGMYIYGIDLKNGFGLKARITHLNDEELKAAKEHWFDYQKAVLRGLYINDVFYTISQKYIKANDMNTFEELNSVELPYIEDIRYVD